VPSPFPGMDPYLEQPEVWAEFHNLAAESQGYLNDRHRPRDVARPVPVTTDDSIASTPTRLIKPDVSGWRDRQRQQGVKAGTATLTPPAVEASIPFMISGSLLISV
jgi:hypothetical protein